MSILILFGLFGLFLSLDVRNVSFFIVQEKPIGREIFRKYVEED